MIPRHSTAQIASAVAYVGTDAAAAAATGIERRTVSRWRAAFRTDPDAFGPDVRRMVDAATAGTAELTRSVRDTVLAEMLRRVADPRTRASDLAAMYRETRDEAALLDGRATARTESMNLNVNAAADIGLTDEQKQDLRAWADSRVARLEAGGATPDLIAEALAPFVVANRRADLLAALASTLYELGMDEAAVERAKIIFVERAGLTMDATLAEARE